jgi:glycosyltransferase involved in cell wall biosynthesis
MKEFTYTKHATVNTVSYSYEQNMFDRENSAITRIAAYCPILLIDLMNYFPITDKAIDVKFEDISVEEHDDKLCVMRVQKWSNVSKKSVVFLHNEQPPKDTDYHILSYNKHFVCIPNEFYPTFSDIFFDSIDGQKFKYDNLLHLVMIVKNSGELLKECLLKNKQWIDEWTILDTGSSDNTVNVIQETLSDKRGNLYQEPFINFRDSRNRAFDLAGTSCVYNIVLDDSYFIENGHTLRDLLTAYRQDKRGRSFSIKIHSKTTSYDSCRITRSDLHLRYKYRVHEFIDDAVPSLVLLPTLTYVWDQDAKYMETRTKSRMSFDLTLLLKDLEEHPTEPRNLFYIAQTYSGLQEWETSMEWYEKRISSPHEGFDEEIYNAMFRIAIIAELKLMWPWEKVHQLYIRAYENRPHRAEPLILIADHYYRNKSYDMAYLYGKRAADIPFPKKEGLFVEKSYYEFELPNLMAKLCYQFQDYTLGEKCATIAYQTTPTEELAEWVTIYQCKQLIQKMNPQKEYMRIVKNKPVLCIVTDGNYFAWNGNTPNTKGLGGSETSAVRFGEEMAKLGYKVYIFCKCVDEEKNEYLEGVVNNVSYINITKYIDFVSTYIIDICIVLRYNIYLPTSYGDNVKHVFLWLQDIAPLNKNLIIDSTKLRSIMCLTNWHKNTFQQMYDWVSPNLVTVTTNAIDLKHFQIDIPIQPLTFIYSSFPNRGLIHLLKMFPSIVKKYPEARLKIFCNLELDVFEKNGQLPLINSIKEMLEQQALTVTNYGWVKKPILIQHWLSSDMWLYPCDFAETSCITALEAAASRTIPICTNLAALNENVGEHGILMPGDPSTEGWKRLALNEIELLVEDRTRMDKMRNESYDWISREKTYQQVASQWDSMFKQYLE